MPPELGQRAPAAADGECAEPGDIEALLGQIERLSAHLADSQHTIQCIQYMRMRDENSVLFTSVPFSFEL